MTERPRLQRAALGMAGVALVGALLIGACGDDSDSTASTATTEHDMGAMDAGSMDHGDGATVGSSNLQDGTLVVHAADYMFEGLPESVPAGTEIELVNDSTTELHELVAMRIPDGDDRSVEEIVSTDFGGLMASGQPALVVLRAPGRGEQIVAVGDGTLAEPGRYAIVCTIPTGIDPQVYLEAAAQSQGGPPQIEGAGAPHIMQGMYAELTVA